MTFLGCFAACVVHFETLLCFDWLCLSEVMAEEILSKFGGIIKVYLRHVEYNSKEVNNSSFDTIIRLNTLKTSKRNKIDKIKGLDEQSLSQLNEKDSEKELDQNLTFEDKHVRTICKIDWHLLKATKKCWAKKKMQWIFEVLSGLRSCLCDTSHTLLYPEESWTLWILRWFSSSLLWSGFQNQDSILWGH